MNYYGASSENYGIFGEQDLANFNVGPDIGAVKKPLIRKLILDIRDEELRESALAQLSKLSGQNQELFNVLGPLLWHSFGTVAILLKEVISVYPLLSPPTLTLAQSDRVSNVNLLLQCVAYHPETRNAFVQSYIPLYLFPFLETSHSDNQFELLRYSSLEVIGRLVETSDSEMIILLLESGLMPRVLYSMDKGIGLSKTMATFILMKIMMNDMAFNYLYSALDRMRAVVKALNNMVDALVKQPSFDCLKSTVACYWRLSDTENGLSLLAYDLPKRLSVETFYHYFCYDQSVFSCMSLLLQNVERYKLQCSVL